MGNHYRTSVEDETAPVAPGRCSLFPGTMRGQPVLQLVERQQEQRLRGLCCHLRRELLQGRRHQVLNQDWREGKTLQHRIKPQSFQQLQGTQAGQRCGELYRYARLQAGGWDDEDGVEDAEAEERKGFNQGNLKDAKDRYDQEKLVIEARNSPHWVEEMNDDFDDM